MDEPWRQRQAQWARFRNWQTTSWVVELSPAECLAEIGALVDRAQQARRPQSEAAEDVAARVQGIRLMRQRLAVLRRTG